MDVDAGNFFLYEAVDQSDADHNHYGPEIEKDKYQNAVAANLEMKLVMKMRSNPEHSREPIFLLDTGSDWQWFDRNKNCLIEVERNSSKVGQGRA